MFRASHALCFYSSFQVPWKITFMKWVTRNRGVAVPAHYLLSPFCFKYRTFCYSTLLLITKKRNMSLLSFRGFIVLVCVGILASQPFKVSGLRSKDLALRWDEGLLPFVRSFRILKAVAVEDLQSKVELVPAPSMTFDPNQSNKRTVRKGPDPIHNRSWPASAMSFLMLRNDKRIHNAKTKPIVLCILNHF